MRISPLLLLITAFLFIQCKTEQENPFRISESAVGKLQRHHLISELDSIYSADSLVRDTPKNKLGNAGSIKVFEKGGKPLLILSPGTDSLQRIENIRILDERFKTEQGVGLQSTFKDIKEHYEVRKIITSLNNLVILLKGSEVYFTISRDQLPESLRYTTESIEAVQIPDAAKIKYMMVGWDKS